MTKSTIHSPIIIINNAYSFRNLGDRAITEAMVAYVRSLVPAAEIFILSQFWKENHTHCERLGCHSYPPLWDIPMDDNKLRRGIRACYSLTRLLLHLGLGIMKPTNPETLELYRIADLILEKGGGSYFSSGRYYLYLGLYQQLFNLWMGKALGKRVVVAPQSIGPFNKRIDELCVAKVLRGADVVMVREPVSKALLESLDVVCSLVPDTAFLGGFLEDRTECVDTIIGALTDNFLNIAVTVLDWRWAVPDVRDSATAIPAYLDKCAQALGRIQQEYPLRVVIVPQVTAGARDDDTDVSNSLAARLEGIVADVKVIRGELSVSDCCRLYGAMDLVLASRLHSAIMAIIQGVPAVALSYQPKSRGVFSLLALNDFVFDIETFSADELFACIKDILENHEAYRIRIEEAANAAHHEVNQQFDKLIKPLLKQLL